MRKSSRLKSILLASCVLPLALGACSKEKKKDAAEDKPGAEAPAEGSAKVTETAPETADKKKSSSSSSALAYLPDSCAVAIHMNLASGFKNATVGKAFLPKIQAAFSEAKADKKEMAAFFDSTGLDPFSDFHEMSVCLPEIPMGGGDPSGVGAITGSAKPGLLAALLATSKDADKFKAIEMGGAKGIDRDGFMIVQLADGTLVGGNDKALLEKAIGKPDGQAAAFATTDSATLRVVVPATVAKMGFSLPDSPFKNFAEKIDGASSISADLESRKVTLRIGTATEEAATELAGIAKMLLGQVPKIPGEGMEAQAAAALAAAVVKGEGTSMVGTVTFEEGTLGMGLDQVASEMK